MPSSDGLELHTDIASIHFNLLGWTAWRVKLGLLEEFQVTLEVEPYVLDSLTTLDELTIFVKLNLYRVGKI